ncbi:hypothetical protein ACVW2L_003567 [Mucilaginibacter sp. HD30]
MKAKQILKQELQVAFSKHAQPVWFRIIKYVLILGAVVFFSRDTLFWPVFILLAVLSVLLHFWYRYKTHGWTKKYGMWKPVKNDTYTKNEETF